VEGRCFEKGEWRGRNEGEGMEMVWEVFWELLDCQSFFFSLFPFHCLFLRRRVKDGNRARDIGLGKPKSSSTSSNPKNQTHLGKRFIITTFTKLPYTPNPLYSSPLGPLFHPFKPLPLSFPLTHHKQKPNTESFAFVRTTSQIYLHQL